MYSHGAHRCMRLARYLDINSLLGIAMLVETRVETVLLDATYIGIRIVLLAVACQIIWSYEHT